MYTPGPMVENMKANTIKIRNMDQERTRGPLARSIQADGKMVSSMVKRRLQMTKARVKKVFGRTEKDRNG